MAYCDINKTFKGFFRYLKFENLQKNQELKLTLKKKRYLNKNSKFIQN